MYVVVPKSNAASRFSSEQQPAPALVGIGDVALRLGLRRAVRVRLHLV
jgi:hypothetical protein